MKKITAAVLAASVGANVIIGSYWLGGRAADRAASERIRDDAPTLLRSVLAIGKLHTVRSTFERTGRIETARRANEAVAWVPGADALVAAATRNTAMMTLRGSVETGVDLKRVTLRRDAAGVVVRLPRAEVYEPTVSAQVHEVKGGAFWRDDEIQVEAIEGAKREFRAAAIASGARERAIAEARRVIADVLARSGARGVRFEEAA